jgi:hypothetical protein
MVTVALLAYIWAHFSNGKIARCWIYLTLSHNDDAKFFHQLPGSVEPLSLIITLGQDFIEPPLYIPLILHFILAVSELSTNFYLTEQLHNFFDQHNLFYLLSKIMLHSYMFCCMHQL